MCDLLKVEALLTLMIYNNANIPTSDEISIESVKFLTLHIYYQHTKVEEK